MPIKALENMAISGSDRFRYADTVETLIKRHKLYGVPLKQVAKEEKFTIGAAEAVIKTYDWICAGHLDTAIEAWGTRAKDVKPLFMNCYRILGLNEFELQKRGLEIDWRIEHGEGKFKDSDEGKPQETSNDSTPLWAQRLLQETATLIDKIEDEIVVNQKCAEILAKKLDEIISLMK